MTLEDFMDQLAALASRYKDACAEELVALSEETQTEHLVAASENGVLVHAYEAGFISGKNAEQRKLQSDEILLKAPGYQMHLSQHNVVVLARKAATMRRIGVENEWKMWRAWLAGQGGNDD